VEPTGQKEMKMKKKIASKDCVRGLGSGQGPNKKKKKKSKKK